ncbi:MAG TPA: aminotransferase class IV [Nocardioides sp.]|uniref:aminotransferase class IV n=1 Tax=Nocardioides sp. TaxID=35761 RepID=UPI002E32AE73|nr:aminotransferase class IV [Nocardioides sp.]HEX3929829.1 aminotransferase class IV [Nocardioides sp.]
MRPDPAYGVFDTLLVRDGRAVDLDAHVRRLAASVSEVYDASVDVEDLSRRIAAGAAGLGTARLRTSYSPEGRAWQAEATAISVPGLSPRTLVARELPGGLGDHKWSDRRAVRDPEGADDVLVVDDGWALECGSATVFAVLGGRVVTPALDGRILPGTVRARVLARLRSEGVPVDERPVAVEELTTAAEVFTTSSIRGVQPVVACHDLASWPVGPLVRRLRD